MIKEFLSKIIFVEIFMIIKKMKWRKATICKGRIKVKKEDIVNYEKI